METETNKQTFSNKTKAKFARVRSRWMVANVLNSVDVAQFVHKRFVTERDSKPETYSEPMSLCNDKVEGRASCFLRPENLKPETKAASVLQSVVLKYRETAIRAMTFSSRSLAWFLYQSRISYVHMLCKKVLKNREVIVFVN